MCSYDEHRNLMCAQYEKKVDEKGKIYLQYTYFGSKPNRGGLKHMKVDNKVILQYKNPDEEHCIVNISVSVIPTTNAHFYYHPICDNGSGVPKFSKQAVGHNKLAKLILDMCKVAGIPGRKTGHSGKVTCATTLSPTEF